MLVDESVCRTDSVGQDDCKEVVVSRWFDRSGKQGHLPVSAGLTTTCIYSNRLSLAH